MAAPTNHDQTPYLCAVVSGEKPLIPVPPGQRVPFGWSAFVVPPTGKGPSAVLRWPAAAIAADIPALADPARFRVTVALDVRESKTVEVRTARTGDLVGTFDIRFASICQPFELMIAPEKASAAFREGVHLRMISGKKPLFLFEKTSGGAPDAFAPHWLGRTKADKWANFHARLTSPASLQAFGWIEGCVLDGLYQQSRVPGGSNAQAALTSHLRHYVSQSGDLHYEGPTSNPLHNTVYGMEGLLPFALIALTEPSNPVLKIAEQAILSRLDAGGAVIDHGNITTEGTYIAGYPLAVLARLWKRDDLRKLAFAQLRNRRDRSLHGETIFQAVGADGKGHLPNWARGVAWYLLGFARVLDTLQPSPEEAADLYREFARAAQWVMSLQQANGLWRNFLDEPKSQPDTSGSAGIAAALAIGARHGWLPAAARQAAERTVAGLETFLTPDGFLRGVAQFNKGGEALQRDSYRVIAPMAMGLTAQLHAELQTGKSG